MVRWPPVQPTLTGPVVLRPWAEQDVDEVFRACQDSEIQRYTNIPVPYLRQHAEFFVGPFQRKNWADRSGAGFAVTDGDGEQLLGACGLVGVDLEARRSGVGYWVAPWGRGRGVATGALALLSAWATAEVGLRELYAEVEEANAASRRVAERAGFVQDDGEQRWEEHRGASRLFHVLVRRAGAQ